MPLTALTLAALTAAPALVGPAPPVRPLPTPGGVAERVDDAFDERFEAAGDDAEKLWTLVIWCEDTERDKQVKTVLRKLIKVDPDHTGARAKLGHVRYDGQWFTTEKKLETYKKKEAERLAKERGLVEFDGEWVEPADLPYLEQGLVRDPSGLGWITRDDLEKLEKGWVRQDLVWVEPAEIEKIEQGLWKCGDEWLDLEAANRYHRRPEQAWEIPSDHVVVRSTCDREVVLKAIDQMERGFPDMVRVFGRAPGAPVPVFVANTSQQLGVLCTEGYRGNPPIETRGLIESVRSLFAEGWYDPESKTWLGAGACWWEAGEEGDKFGVHDARMAMGLSFVDALDPSPKALDKLRKKKGPYDGFAEAYYAEKQLPPWLRWGAACYASRYFSDQVGAGGDPFWTRKWSVDNLKRRGGLPSFLRTVFEMELTGREQDGRMVLAAGLLVAFVVDGECAPVRAAHAELKAVLRSGKDPEKVLGQLRKAIEKHEKELRAFAGL